MLQADKYWAPLLRSRRHGPTWPPIRALPNAGSRRENIDACYAEVKALFAARTLAEWREILARQDGQWDVVQDVGEMQGRRAGRRPTTISRAVDYGDGTTIPLVSVPMLFDGEAMPARRSPELGADSDAVLASLGYDEDAIIDLKVQGVVF